MLAPGMLGNSKFYGLRKPILRRPLLVFTDGMGFHVDRPPDDSLDHTVFSFFS